MMIPVGLGHDEVASISFAQSVPGVPHLKEGDARPQGGRPRWAAPPNPRMGPWLILLKKIAQSHNLLPEFEINLYRQRIWMCKLTGKSNLTYEEALVSEKAAGKEAQRFPKELMAPVLRDVQFSMLSLKDLANTIAIKLQGCLSEGSELYGTMNSCVYPCKIVRVLENEKPLYEVAWQDKYDKVRENTLLKEEDLIVKKLPCSKGALKLFIRESTYHSIPWDGLVVTNRKRKKSGDRKNDAEVDKDEFLDPKRKNTGREQHKGFTDEEIFENGTSETLPIKYPIDDLLVQPSDSDIQLTERSPLRWDFNVPMHCVGDLLMVWDFCISFGRLLQLSPFSLEDFENAVCHKESNVVLIVESHAALLRLLIKDNGEYFTAIQKKKRKSKITLITWTEYLCDFLEMTGIAELSAHISTIKRGHYGLLDVHVKLAILRELVAQALESDLFKEKLDEDMDKRQALAAARRDEALEEGRKRREEKERLKIQSTGKDAMNGHGNSVDPLNVKKNVDAPKKGSDDSESELEDVTFKNAKKQKINEKDAAEYMDDSPKKAANKDEMDESPEKCKDHQRAAHKMRKNEIKETIENRSKEQRKEYLDREIEKTIIRTNPLGKDRDYNTYWFFRRDARIFVESSDSMRWGYYYTKDELDALLGSLNVKGVRERALKKQLENFYGKISLEIQKRSKEAALRVAMEEAVLRRSTRVRAPPRDNPALAFLKGIDSDEWGFITPKEKFGEQGYKEGWVVLSSISEDEIIEKGCLGESEDELVSVDEECSEYDADIVDELEVDGSYADVNDWLNLSEETPIAAGSDGEVESTRRNLEVGEQREGQEIHHNAEPEVGEQREGQERQDNAEPEENKEKGRKDNIMQNLRSNLEPEVEAQTEGQEEMIIHTQPDVESETQEETWNTSLFEIPVECHDSVIGMRTIRVECDSTAIMDFNFSTQGVNLNLGNTRRVEQHQKGMLMKAKGKQKALGLTKKKTIFKRKYSTRSTSKSKFSNTANDPITLE
nr:DDT domain-containing protein DDB_G0282237 [Ipomoea batatas]